MTVLDTHAWLWWLSDPDRLSEPARRAIRRAMDDDAIAISTISAWEVALLVQRGRLVLDRPVDVFVRDTDFFSYVRFVDIDVRTAVASTRLSLPHRDPADRIIVATTRLLDATLVTADQRLRDWDGVRTVW